MATIIDAPRTDLDKTVRIFDSFYNFDLVVESNQYEIVYSLFMELTKSASIAKNFTTMVFRIANSTGDNVLDLVDYLRGSSKLEVNSLLAYHLNTFKSKTTLYGVGNIPQPNQYIQRNVIA
jgi:hypothetical protein